MRNSTAATAVDPNVAKPAQKGLLNDTAAAGSAGSRFCRITSFAQTEQNFWGVRALLVPVAPNIVHSGVPDHFQVASF